MTIINISANNLNEIVNFSNMLDEIINGKIDKDIQTSSSIKKTNKRIENKYYILNDNTDNKISKYDINISSIKYSEEEIIEETEEE